jgi:catechol 2,3-dioxygenase-like lactoylglutathione lyase family enzyme
MFEKLMATAVLPASDLARAKQWWHDVLGRDPVFEETEGEALFYEIGGTVILVYRTEYAGTAQNTALNLVTEDLDRDMTALRTHGVMFHDYDLPGVKTVDGVAQLGDLRGAWFSDSEGNIIGIGEATPEMMEMAARMRAGASGSA